MISINGNDVFPNDRFRPFAWSAPVYTTPEELRERLNSFKLTGRIIKSIRVLGPVNIDNRDPEDLLLETKDDLMLRRHIENDEPIIIVFDNDEQFEVHFVDGSNVRCSMNCFPKSIRSSYEYENINGNVFFANLIGKTIVDTRICDYQAGWRENTGLYGEYDYHQESYIDSFYLLCREPGGDLYSLHFSSYLDYAEVWEEKYSDTTTICITKIQEAISTSGTSQHIPAQWMAADYGTETEDGPNSNPVYMRKTVNEDVYDLYHPYHNQPYYVRKNSEIIGSMDPDEVSAAALDEFISGDRNNEKEDY